MNALVCLPSLLCGIWLSALDVKSRRVPRRIVAVGIVLQCTCFLIACVGLGCWEQLGCAIGCALVATSMQLLLALIRPGALGFGDVTTCMLVTFATGWFGWMALAWWWLVMSVIGVAWTGIWSAISSSISRRSVQDSAYIETTSATSTGVPFVPVLVSAGVLAVWIAH